MLVSSTVLSLESVINKSKKSIISDKFYPADKHPFIHLGDSAHLTKSIILLVVHNILKENETFISLHKKTNHDFS